jgi:hypothetical protein
VADKITQQITDALTKAAAHPAGLLLYAGKSDAGLFPNTAAAKPAAQKCLADGLICVVGTDSKSKTARDLYALTDAGWEFLIAQVNPKQVLEDFVRVLEARQGEVGELLDTARRMADSLQGLKEAVARVLPVVSTTRIVERDQKGSANPNHALPFGSRLSGSVDLLEAPPEANLAPAILARLADWSGPTDCTLPELFRSISICDTPPTIGQFHDSLRELCSEGALALHSWTGPLYAMPEPAYALLVGHGIAYYASLREAGLNSEVRSQASGVRESDFPDSRLPTPNSRLPTPVS